MRQTASTEAAPARKALSGKSKVRTVLVVEDEWLIRELVAEILGADGHHVLVAADAAEAMDVLLGEPIDLLFTDIDLGPGKSGLSLARDARGVRPELKVIYASGRRRGLDPGQAVAGSVFMAKPYRPMEMRSLVARMLGDEAGGAKAS